MKKGRKPKNQPVPNDEESGSEMEDIEEPQNLEGNAPHYKPDCTIDIKFR